jgi:hypothetical protein
MYRNGKLFDLERVVFERTRGDGPHAPPASPPRSCQLLQIFKVERRALGGTGGRSVA